MKLPEEIFKTLRENNEEAGLEYQTGDIGEPWILVETSSLKSVMKTLRDDPQLLFDVLMCLSGVHYQKEEELGVTYHLSSTSLGHKLAVKVRVPIDNPHVPSVESIWKTANWHEREAWDMVGVIFDEHPNHKRILCPEDWEGHPLRKDYVQQEFYQGIPTGE
ncbi:MAG: NADH-quinone oxidoreductase subunit C [Bacteroidetes bacterium]|jgi:NADH-quinone oxidoreductase subunit C|nr:NADH-quinone oxidoreductase subunit C [Bacteroidota bacterium]